LEHELMVIARVVGSVVSTQKNGKLEGAKLLLTQPLDLDGKDRGTAVMAIDAVDAGVGDRVLLVLDGKAAMMALNRGLAGVDAAIIGVVDSVDMPAEPARR
jgi:microcompartment protein CcmK/EutM